MAIENKLREYWREELHNFITNRSLNLNNVGLRIIVKQLTELNEDINEYLNTRTFKKYKTQYLRLIEPSLILSVVMSKCIPFVVKYENCEEQPVTKLFFKTDEAI